MGYIVLSITGAVKVSHLTIEEGKQTLVNPYRPFVTDSMTRGFVAGSLKVYVLELASCYQLEGCKSLSLSSCQSL